MADLVGQSLGRYHILEQLGEGGMAVVYKAFDTRLERNVAVKVILSGKEHKEKFLKRFEREAKALASLSHPNIVKVIDYGDHEGVPYLVMEYIPGGTLKQKLSNKPVSWQEAIRLLLPIARSLAYAHENKIIHRDIKPANILITQSGEPMLSDFGIAKILEVEETLDLTGVGVGIGTPEYMSPEQAQGNLVDARADIYSLGVVFYELVTGRKPYQADTPMAVVYKLASEPLPRPKNFVPELPDYVDELLLKALAKNPKDRFQDMGEFAAGLEKRLAMAGKPDDKKPNGWGMSWVKWGIAFAVLLVLSGVFFSFFKSRLALPAFSGISSVTQPASLEAQQIPMPTLDCRDGNNCVTVAPDKVTYRIIVDAKKQWSDTGILVHENDLVRIYNLTGRWRSSPDYSWVDGTQCGNTCLDCLMTSTEEGSLVARIGGGEHYCGANSETISDRGGKLSLSFNDCPSDTSCFSDNQGQLEMLVDVIPNSSGSTPGQEFTFLVAEDFEDSKIQLENFSTDSNQWQIVEEMDGNKVFQVDNRNGLEYPSFAFGEDQWTDYITEYRVKLLDQTGSVGIQVRSDTSSAYYVVDMGVGEMYLAYPTATEWVRLLTKFPPVKLDTWHTFKVIVNGNNIQVFIDNARWIDTDDSRYAKGAILIFASPGTYAQIDDIKVVEIKK